MDSEQARLSRPSKVLRLAWAGICGWLDWGLAALSIKGGIQALKSSDRQEAFMAFGMAFLYAVFGVLVFSAMGQRARIPGQKILLIFAVIGFGLFGAFILSTDSMPIGALFLGLALGHYKALRELD